MTKPYHELIAGRIYCGGAQDIQQMVDDEGITLVVDLRAESTGCAASQPGLQWLQIPLSDHAEQPEDELFRAAIHAVVDAYRQGQKVAFHCGGGKGRTGTVAAGVLLELGLCKNVPEAEAMAKSIRPVINIKSDQRLSLSRLYPHQGDAGSAVPMSFFERYLTAWVALCIVVGIALGQAMPGLFKAIGALEIAKVNLPVGLLIWVMIIPMLLKIDFSALHQVKEHVRGIGVTLVINWLVKPFSMAFLGWLFIRVLFADWLPADQLDSYVAGLILLAAAPCTAMVFVWSRLTNGDPYFTLSQVALNDLIMVFAFAPLVALLLGVSSITVPWDTLLTSVVLYIVIPVIIAQLMRRALLRQGQTRFDAVMHRIQPCSIAALLLTLVLLFAFQGDAIIQQPLVIALLAVPILIQVLFNSGLAYWLNRKVGEKHSVACPSALIGASNFFELAVAAAISLFGFHSGAALATVVGVLIEVPVMLLVVKIVNRSKGWYEQGLPRS